MFETDGFIDGIAHVGSWIMEFDPKVAMRDLKIRLITTDDISFNISPLKIIKYKNELDFLKLTCKDDVITGSFALNLYDLLDRDSLDIDILIKDKDRYPKGHYYKDHSYSSDVGLSDNRLGYKNHIYIC